MRVTVLLAALRGLLIKEVVNANPLSRLGCRYYEDALIFNCNGSSLDRVVEAIRYLEQKFIHTNRIPVRHVNLLHGNFTELPFFLSKFNETLEGIRIHNTSLTHIYPDAFSGLSRVRFLDLSKNNLTAIPYAISTLHNLQFLNVSSNRLRRLEPQSQFSSWKRLRLLDLSSNYIDKLELLDLKPSSATVERLLLDNNDIASVPQEWSSLPLPQLKEISINNNALTTFPWFHLKFTPRLITVRLRKNNIETFPFYFMSSHPGENLTIDMSGELTT
ncbi:leucine-rich transmembrane protein-like [Tropilaelaps mercedesae]|uniref:Leucine-rich transmembrane protein-like n=1 Tax=Tropilaelaps mercedesae TaxID=418985 RepID=A0A1V9XK20_9ACAR|nr:leucine-rich transmembrane protein-like [Tropilaelaps mercedesae]